MYSENPARDVLLFSKAVVSNQLARFWPKLYVDLTLQTGRGVGEDDASQVADYFIQCFQDYREQMEFSDEEFSRYLSGKTVLEYGPGDILGVALLVYAHGADKVECVDRFPLSKLSNKNVDVYFRILNSLDQNKRERASEAFKEKGNPRSGFNPDAISYKVTRNGLAEARNEYDLVISRAVLEHVNSLEETILDIGQCMKSGGISLHQVDLSSHGLDRDTKFDFLTWPAIAYRLMYSHKGFPNRRRVDKYRELAAQSCLKVKKLSPTTTVGMEALNTIYPKLAKEFRHISLEDLSWQGFWMILERV